MRVFEIQSTIMLVIFAVLLVVKLFAFISALTFSSQSYEAAGKLTKPAWSLILGLGVVLHFLGMVLRLPIGFTGILGIAFTVAAFVYLADVRPALNGLTRR
ncbi:DUF2516 family protein [Nocardioides fonticola]|uniref:DUF2516 family protein n=1 Tax=Nocardioides fonticola TaxID=450363 RepID=A0ABP7XB36_9ACTN